VSDGAVRLVLWAHPILGLVVTALAVRTATLAVQGRGRGPRALAHRAQHRKLSPWAYGLAVVAWIGGVLSVWLWRPDLDVTDSGHFQIGGVIIVLFSLAALVSRRVPTDAWARAVHPWIGAAVLMALGVQVFLGLQLMPR
jgi:hypothetical protein